MSVSSQRPCSWRARQRQRPAAAAARERADGVTCTFSTLSAGTAALAALMSTVAAAAKRSIVSGAGGGLMALLAATAVAGEAADDRKKMDKTRPRSCRHLDHVDFSRGWLRRVGGMPAPPTSGLRGDDGGAASARAVRAERTVAGLQAQRPTRKKTRAETLRLATILDDPRGGR